MGIRFSRQERVKGMEPKLELRLSNNNEVESRQELNLLDCLDNRSLNILEPRAGRKGSEAGFLLQILPKEILKLAGIGWAPECP
ncbi:hypothetical protein CRYUN_Cryun14cG0127600 [Craigia yunnanensis]